jgi:hypothetical protein
VTLDRLATGGIKKEMRIFKGRFLMCAFPEFVEKVNAKKIDLTRIISFENGMCPHLKDIRGRRCVNEEKIV